MGLKFSEDFDYNSTLEQSLPLDDSMECDFLGEQETVPRIGEDYQVEIPAVLEKSEYFNHAQSPKAVEGHAHDYFLGVSVPVTSIKQEDKKLEHGETDVELMPDDDYLVPGSASGSWSEADKPSFLLGLYIFSRNFARLKQFLVSKKMEDILSFYYGEFYRSHEYCRWSESQKMRKRGVVVQNIFTGLRKQELLSRILPSLSEERKNATLQVLKTFLELKIPFEEFIFSIKEIIGIRTLVEAVGIGKGKKDLTTMTLAPSRINQVNPVVPTGKAYSSLTPDEIVKYLNGNRLSKARSHDLFWEAVWPRLLARGWNAEDPKGQVYNASGSKNNLIFLVPGVTKSSRRKLKKGADYFDSVSDVLNKISSDPSLLELYNNDEEHGTKNETKSEDDDMGTETRHSYLQPRATNSTTEGLKFTVVDTCSGDCKPYQVRELSGLTFDDYCKVNSVRCNENIEEADAVDSDAPVFEIDDSEGSSGKDLNIDDDPVIKRRRLTACNNAEPRNDVTSRPDVPVKRGQELAIPTVVIALPASLGNLRQENRHCNSTVDDIVDEPLRCSISTTQNVECDDIINSNDLPDSQQTVKIRHNFDLNLPPEPDNESTVAESNGTEHKHEMSQSQRDDDDDVNPQRRGTRNRPPTTRSLEAVAYGFLSTNTRQQKAGPSRAANVRKGSSSSR